MKVAQIMCELHSMLLHYKFDKTRWAYKVSPSEWDQVAANIVRLRHVNAFLGGSAPPWEINKLTLLGVELIRDDSLEVPVPVLKDYGSSG